MPELPEAETIARTLGPRVLGRRISGVQFLSPRAHRGRPFTLSGRLIRGVRRHGKAVLLEMDQGVLAVHLGMTGRLLHGGEPGPYTRAVIALDKGVIRFDDIRQFGFLRLLEEPSGRLGPDALDLPFVEFAALFPGRRGLLKPLLLNQAFVRGIGNIYADEILFRARIHPRAPAGRLGSARIRRLYGAIHEVLAEAIAAGGSSISDYVDAEGRTGSFQLLHRVYRKTGQPCPACGAPLRRIVLAQRGTHYCPRCLKS